MSDDDIQETEDASTSYELREVSTRTYSERSDEETAIDPGDSADEVDPRKLMGDPSLNELRWLWRTSLGNTLVDKPVDDAFKNGFEIDDSDTDRDVTQILERLGWEEHYKSVKKKTRRDGFALTFFVLEDDTESVADDPIDAQVNEVKKLEIITLDDLAYYDSGYGTIPAGDDNDPLDDLDIDDYEIRPTGIVMDTDTTSDTYKEPLGYLIGPPEWIDSQNPVDDVEFHHRNRFQHHVVNKEVDLDLEEPSLGAYEGDSVLVAPYHMLRGLKRANWSIMQTVFRYAAKMYHVELPEDADEEDWDNANDEMQNLNTKSELITPHGYEIDDFATDGQLQPREYFDVIFEQICATSEMTKSVLFGTQSGTVTGSETDIKNYFNKVERMRGGDIVDDMHGFVAQYVSLVDGRATEGYEVDFDVDWGPMFKLSQLDNAERISRVMQTLSAGINDFILTPQEARSILQEEWADVDIDWQSDFSDEDREWLQNLNVAQMGAEVAYQGGEGEGEEMEGNPRVGQNGGGMEQGQQTASANPTADLTNRDIDRIAERVAEMVDQ